MKNNTLTDSIKCAVRGLVYGFKTEKNFFRYIIIALIFLVINVLFRASVTAHMIYLLVCGGVFSAEFINTSIERLADKIESRFSNEIKIVKDVAAAGVLVWGIVFFAMEAIIIGSRFI